MEYIRSKRQVHEQIAYRRLVKDTGIEHRNETGRHCQYPIPSFCACSASASRAARLCPMRSFLYSSRSRK